MSGKRRGSPKKARLKRASELLHRAWDTLEPEDLSEARWGDLRNVITSVLAALNR